MKRMIEARPAAPLYHFGTDGTLELLVAYDKLGYTDKEASFFNKLLKDQRSNIVNDWISGNTVKGIESMVLNIRPSVVSFTRDRNHFFSKNRPIMLVVDQQKLSYNYKLVPTSGDSSSHGSEAEERVNKVIHNMSKYLLEIWVDPSNWKIFDFGKDLPPDYMFDDNYDEYPEQYSEFSKEEQEYLENLESVTTKEVEKYCSRNSIDLIVRKL